MNITHTKRLPHASEITLEIDGKTYTVGKLDNFGTYTCMVSENPCGAALWGETLEDLAHKIRQAA